MIRQLLAIYDNCLKIGQTIASFTVDSYCKRTNCNTIDRVKVKDEGQGKSAVIIHKEKSHRLRIIGICFFLKSIVRDARQFFS
jgi:hypothetical protein